MGKSEKEGYVFTARTEDGSRLKWLWRILGAQGCPGKLLIKLFMEEQVEPLCIARRGCASAHPGQVIEQVFQEWVVSGRFKRTVKDPELLKVLKQAQIERLIGVPWYHRTHRFLRLEGGLRFVFTTDKSDLPEFEKRILEGGEDTAYAELAVQELQNAVAQERNRMCRETLRAEHIVLITTVAQAAINERPVSPDAVRQLSDLGLLEPTTPFRRSRVPKEHTFLKYDFTNRDGVRHTGLVGFSADFRVASVTEKLPEEREFCCILSASP